MLAMLVKAADLCAAFFYYPPLLNFSASRYGDEPKLYISLKSLILLALRRLFQIILHHSFIMSYNYDQLLIIDSKKAEGLLYERWYYRNRQIRSGEGRYKF